MPPTFINGDGGHLPPSATPPTASQMLADYNALSPSDKTALRTALAPAHYNISEAADLMIEHADALPGDTASIADSDSLFRLHSLPAEGWNWQDIIAGEYVTEPSAAIPLDPPGPGTLAAAWRAMSAAQRAAFRLAVKPAFSTVADQTARLALTNQMPGDYCRQSGNETLYRLRVLPASTDGNWDAIHINPS